MPELTEATEAKPEVKVEVESGSDSDSDDSVPELEDGINETASKVSKSESVFLLTGTKCQISCNCFFVP